MSGEINDQKMQVSAEDLKMQDDEAQRNDRRHISSLNMNRKQRRNFAKKYKLFQDPTREAWRIGNKHMKGDKQNRETEHRLGAE